VLRDSAEDSAIISTTPPLGGEVGDAQTKQFFFFRPLELTQRVTPLLKEVKEGLAHLRLGPVARRHACECLEKPALQLEKLVVVIRAEWRCGKASSMQGRVQRCFGGQSAEGLQPWRVGFVETSTRVTQAYKERGPSPASGRRTAAGAL
jgi:hypothetical protein